MYSEKTAGQFRANKEAASPNNLRLVDPETPGTPAQDNGTIEVNGAGSTATGIQYIGKDGVSRYIPFFDYEYPSGQMIETEVQMLPTQMDTFKKRLQQVVEMHEVDPVITVTENTGDWVVRHVGSGTIDYVLVDGVADQLTRTAL